MIHLYAGLSTRCTLVMLLTLCMPLQVHALESGATGRFHPSRFSFNSFFSYFRSSSDPQGAGAMSTSSWAKNVLFFLIIIQLIPAALKLGKQGWDNLLHPKTKVGVVTIKDEIRDSAGAIRQAQEFFADPHIKAILLVVDSPGGSSGASQAIWHSIRELKAKHEKPVIAWVQNIAASGGYYIVCAADHIVAAPSAVIGSIGVILPQWGLKDFINHWHINYNTINAGKFKTTSNPFLPAPNAEQNNMLKSVVDDVYQQFVQDVRLSRPHIVGADDQWGDGRIFTARQAHKLGLIDELGSQITVEAAVKRIGNITTDIEWVRPTRARGLARILGGAEENEDGSSFVASCADTLWQRLFVKIKAESSTLQL